MTEFIFKLLGTETVIFIIIYSLLHPDAPLGDLVIQSNLDYGKILNIICFVGLSIISITLLFLIWNL